MFRNKACFYGEDLSTHRPTSKLEDRTLSAVRDCLFNLFTATLHIGGRSSIRNLRTCHAIVTGTHKHGIPQLVKEFPILYGSVMLRYCIYKSLSQVEGTTYLTYKLSDLTK